ncbi:hypothetical protein ACP70R_021087 [Stipagrostis hirtigluma subsp. patula]
MQQLLVSLSTKFGGQVHLMRRHRSPPASAVAESGLALELEALFVGTGHLPPLLDCAPARPASSDSQNDSAFRDNVLSVLGTIPFAAAAAPSGFAATWSDGAGRDPLLRRARPPLRRVPVRAAEDVAGGCSGGSRRAGVWRAGRFLSFADTNASSARKSAFRGWLYDDGGTTAAPPEAQCAGDRTPAECSRCANESARVVPSLKLAHRVSTFCGEAVVVVGYDCCLRVQLVPPPPRWVRVVGHIVLVVDVIVILGGLVFCIKKACDPA